MTNDIIEFMRTKIKHTESQPNPIPHEVVKEGYASACRFAVEAGIFDLTVIMS